MFKQYFRKKRSKFVVEIWDGTIFGYTYTIYYDPKHENYWTYIIGGNYETGYLEGINCIPTSIMKTFIEKDSKNYDQQILSDHISHRLEVKQITKKLSKNEDNTKKEA